MPWENYQSIMIWEEALANNYIDFLLDEYRKHAQGKHQSLTW